MADDELTRRTIMTDAGMRAVEQGLPLMKIPIWVVRMRERVEIAVVMRPTAWAVGRPRSSSQTRARGRRAGHD